MATDIGINPHSWTLVDLPALRRQVESGDFLPADRPIERAG